MLTDVSHSPLFPSVRQGNKCHTFVFSSSALWSYQHLESSIIIHNMTTNTLEISGDDISPVHT